MSAQSASVLSRPPSQAELKDIFAFKYGDFKLEGYTAHPTIKAPIAV